MIGWFAWSGADTKNDIVAAHLALLRCVNQIIPIWFDVRQPAGVCGVNDQ